MTEEIKPAIWVIEDAPIIRRGIVHVLKDKYDITEFSLASAAIEKMKEIEKSEDNSQKPVMILTDNNIQTELTSGLDVIREATIHGIPSVLHSGDIGKVGQKALNLGAISVLKKPAHDAELLYAVAQAIGKLPTAAIEEQEKVAKENKTQSLLDKLGLNTKISGWSKWRK